LVAQVDTQDDSSIESRGLELPVPGVVVVFSGTEPMLRACALENGKLTLGRNSLPFVADERISRDHAELVYNGGNWTVRDLGSRNGTFVDGVPVQGEVRVHAPRVIRIGATIMLAMPDVRRIENASIAVVDGSVIGPTLRGALDAIVHVAGSSTSLLITGESGTGKELAARTFHRNGPNQAGRFVAVNCAAIPEGVAERLLFGAKRGAYSGATTDGEGYCEAADQGVLFLDEIGELEPSVQAKLLRVLESDEVLPLGASVPKRVNARFVFATHRDLRSNVATNEFRADLYFRIAHAEVTLPPLRERPEEVPALIAHTLAAQQLRPHAKLVEACMLRPWPGNARELVGAMRRAATATTAAGETLVRCEVLHPNAGIAFGDEGPREPEIDPLPGRPRPSEIAKETIEATLAAAGGNMAAAARSLGLHRTQLYRLMRKHGIDTARE
jgi:transcriptional regulator with GAF, ATPase, and Fis domain